MMYMLKQLRFISLHLLFCTIFFGLFSVSSTPTPRLIATGDNQQAATVRLPPTYTLSVTVFGGGVVLRSPAKSSYVYGEQVELTAIPIQGQTFLDWKGDVEGQELSIAFAVERNKAITATFTGAGLSLTLDTLGAGVVQAEPVQDSYTPGAHVTLTAMPGAGWHFAGWNGNLGANNPLVLTMHRDRHIVATFVQLYHTLALGRYTHGQVAITPQKERYLHGDIVTLTAFPDAGYRFAKWQVSQAGSPIEQVVTDNPATFSMLANVIYTPHFADAPNNTATSYLPLIVQN